MSAYLRLFILCVCVAVSVAVLPANVPNIIMAKSSPSTKSLKVKPSRPPRNKERYDNSVNDYLSERICGLNEMCKEEFSTKFRCRCPYWSFCSSPGRYYNAYCVMSDAGYLWTQPQGFFNNQPSKSTRYKKKLHNVHKAKSDKSLPRSLTSK
ncbi:uncharacterized protein LOC110847367 [Folsomia candida]|uniref:Uncharacterized protein n=1 Tax=Folsomia candida TaxID=158441 RepID=A0A226EJH9_FOLCA|nr:uncharacterized protein LOC110847367 [Folsomia candida]OXA57873.1 hypothetical protein Fcan01_08179 [Folsomia candida]